MVKQQKQNSILSSIFQSFGILTIVGLSLLLLFQIIIFIYMFATTTSYPENETILKDLRANISKIEKYNIVKIDSFKSTSTNEGSGINFNGSLKFTYEDEYGEMIEKTSDIIVYYTHSSEEPKYEYRRCRFLDIPDNETILRDFRANIATIEEYNIVKIYSFKSIGEPVENGGISFNGDLSFTYEDENEKRIEKTSEVSVFYKYSSGESKYVYDSCRFLDYPEEE